MRDFRRTGLEVLFVLNMIAWSLYFLYEIKLDRLIKAEGLVVESVIVPNRTDGRMRATRETVRVRVKYQFNQINYEQYAMISEINGESIRKNELKYYYYPGREITLWIDPKFPNEPEFDNENYHFILPSLFLMVLFIFYLFTRRSEKLA